MEEDDIEAASDILKDKFRLSVITISEAEARRNSMEISEPTSICVADLAFKYAELLAKDVKRFAGHAGRKTIRTQDVIISAHRNEGVTAAMESFCDNLKRQVPRQQQQQPQSQPRPPSQRVRKTIVHLQEEPSATSTEQASNES